MFVRVCACVRVCVCVLVRFNVTLCALQADDVVTTNVYKEGRHPAHGAWLKSSCTWSQVHINNTTTSLGVSTRHDVILSRERHGH